MTRRCRKIKKPHNNDLIVSQQQRQPPLFWQGCKIVAGGKKQPPCRHTQKPRSGIGVPARPPDLMLTWFLCAPSPAPLCLFEASVYRCGKSFAPFKSWGLINLPGSSSMYGNIVPSLPCARSETQTRKQQERVRYLSSLCGSARLDYVASDFKPPKTWE